MPGVRLAQPLRVMKTARALLAIFTVILLAVATNASAQQASASDSSAAPAAAPAAAPDEDTNNAELAKKLSNPIADLVSLPFQFNWENGIGPLDLTRYILNIQPVMPFALNKKVNMIVRVIAPIVSQPAPQIPGGVAASGVSDVLTSFFFSPSKSAVIWGVGPVVSVPSTTVPALGTEKWSAGPTAVVLKQEGGLTYGALVNQVWSFAGNASREDVSQMFLQPFVAYTTSGAWTFTAQSESTANWQIDGDGRWNVPINGLVAKLSSFGTFPASYQLGGGYFVVHPDNGATWKIRAAITILLPRKK
jgi:hypothetical protein